MTSRRYPVPGGSVLATKPNFATAIAEIEGFEASLRQVAGTGIDILGDLPQLLICSVVRVLGRGHTASGYHL